MNSHRAFYGLIGVVVLLFLAAFGGTYYGTNLLKTKGDDLLSLKVQGAGLDAKETSLIQAKKDITKYTELERIARSIVPQEKDQAKTILEIGQVADESGVSLAAFQFPDSMLGQKTTSTTTCPNGNTQYIKVKDLTGVCSMDIVVQADSTKLITYNQLLTFLNKLEHNRRTADITNINVQPSDQNPNLLSFTLTLTVFIKP